MINEKTSSKGSTQSYISPLISPGISLHLYLQTHVSLFHYLLPSARLITLLERPIIKRYAAVDLCVLISGENNISQSVSIADNHKGAVINYGEEGGGV